MEKLSVIATFEVRAEAFRLMTGVMAPGKDEGALGASGRTLEERASMYEAWYNQYRDCVNAVIKAFETAGG